jgi:hypothetical protein
MPKVSYLGVFALAATLTMGCKDSQSEESNPPGQQASAGQSEAAGAAGASTGAPAGTAGGQGTAQAPVTNANGVVPGSKDDPRYHGPEVSKEEGQAGGVVILWPRVIPSNIAAQNAGTASSLQQHMQQIVARALPGRPVELRPSPERVCPRGGCKAPSISVLFTRNQNACVAIALISGPGETPAKMIPWAGTIVFKGGDSAPFRQPPENQITIKDYVPCDTLLTEMGKADAQVEAALRMAAAQ